MDKISHKESSHKESSHKESSHKIDTKRTELIIQREELFSQYKECMETNNYAVKECDYIIALAKAIPPNQ